MNASGTCKSSSAIVEALAQEHLYSSEIHCGVMEKPWNKHQSVRTWFCPDKLFDLGPSWDWVLHLKNAGAFFFSF